MPFAALYCRVSTDQQSTDGAGLDIQETACRDYAAAHGYTVLDRHVYREVYTGADLRGRPQLRILLDALSRREIGVVVAYALDRLSRDQVHTFALLEEIEAAGARLELVLEEFERTPLGLLYMQIKAFAAAAERERIILRTQSGRRARAERGLPHFGAHAPYGYTINAGRTGYDVDAGQVDTVRRIFDLVAAGATLREVARLLNEDGVPAPTGRIWRHSQIYSMVINPIYAGQAAGYRWRARSDKVLRRLRPVDDWIPLPAAAPAIVTPDQHAATQQRLALNKAAALRNTRDPERYLLGGGLAYCGHCGARMHGAGTASGRINYRCGHAPRDTEAARSRCPERPQISVSRLDAEVWEAVAAHLGDAGALLALGRRDTTPPGQHTEIDRLTRAIAMLTGEIDNLTDRIASLPSENVEVALDGLRRRNASRQRYRDQLSALQTQSATQRQGAARERSMAAWLAQYGDNLASLRTSGKRDLIRLLGLQVRIERVNGRIEWLLEADS